MGKLVKEKNTNRILNRIMWENLNLFNLIFFIWCLGSQKRVTIFIKQHFEVMSSIPARSCLSLGLDLTINININIIVALNQTTQKDGPSSLTQLHPTNQHIVRVFPSLLLMDGTWYTVHPGPKNKSNFNYESRQVLQLSVWSHLDWFESCMNWFYTYTPLS